MLTLVSLTIGPQGRNPNQIQVGSVSDLKDYFGLRFEMDT